jgi:hypothetical protein
LIVKTVGNFVAHDGADTSVVEIFGPVGVVEGELENSSNEC